MLICMYISVRSGASFVGLIRRRSMAGLNQSSSAGLSFPGPGKATIAAGSHHFRSVSASWLRPAIILGDKAGSKLKHRLFPGPGELQPGTFLLWRMRGHYRVSGSYNHREAVATAIVV